MVFLLLVVGFSLFGDFAVVWLRDVDFWFRGCVFRLTN